MVIGHSIDENIFKEKNWKIYELTSTEFFYIENNGIL